MRLAFTTFALLKAPYGTPETQGFEERTPRVFEEAESAPGFIDRAKALDGDDNVSNFVKNWEKWGPFAVPSYYTLGCEPETDQRASTLSLWQDIESVARFAYRGLHAEALRKRSLWFQKPDWPTYAMWWVERDHIPRWSEAAAKLDELHRYGPRPTVFNFKCCFDQAGQKLDHARFL